MKASRRVACVFLVPRNRGSDLSPLAEACGRFSSQIGIRPGEAVFIETGGSRSLFSEAFLHQKLKVLAARMGWVVRVATAPTAELALAMARYPQFDQSKDYGDLPIDGIADLNSPFVLSPESQREIHTMVTLLRMMGVHNLKDFLKLPREEVGSALGEGGVRVFEKAREMKEAPWLTFRPLEKIVESLEDCEEMEGEGLLFAIKIVLDRVVARLRGRLERVAQLRLRFDAVVWSTCHQKFREWVLDFPVAQGSVSGILPIVREKLLQAMEQQPLGSPVARISVTVERTAPSVGAQRDFFCFQEQEFEVWEALAGRLIQECGQENVFFASTVDRYRPEAAWKKEACTSLEGASDVCYHDPVSLELPTRLLERPEVLFKNNLELIHPSGKRWFIRSTEGPRRISGEWWSTLFVRDYYRVETHTGEWLWIFMDRVHTPSQVYLHGYFD